MLLALATESRRAWQPVSRPHYKCRFREMQSTSGPGTLSDLADFGHGVVARYSLVCGRVPHREETTKRSGLNALVWGRANAGVADPTTRTATVAPRKTCLIRRIDSYSFGQGAPRIGAPSFCEAGAAVPMALTATMLGHLDVWTLPFGKGPLRPLHWRDAAPPSGREAPLSVEAISYR